ncbi:class I tRNA ligase family protein, partial [Candidatus Gottesmanbacteria bacterium]|nr:class I tRNA ligase family protein [Candidatus Gottesmanbacteria bacterium]
AKLGNMYDWSRTVETCKPDYYKWTQWIFIKMFEAGLAYRAKAMVNFCPKCKTVLSDEQVIDEKCERCSSLVEKKELEQWFFRITKYAERLLANLEKLDWSQKVKTSQKNWIGKKEGAEIRFWTSQNDEFIEIFTTKPETIFGATFVVLSPNHPLANKIRTVINPANQKEIPVFVDEYVLDEVGTGAIMGVPAHDERDLAFAKKHNLPIIKAPFANKSNLSNLTNSVVIYHLRDWLISRQRYWGPPIPMIFCDKCQWQPVPEKDLPVLLPDIADYQPKGEGKGPLANHPEFYKTVCPKCGGEATRETDVSDTFLDSAWYELRYPSQNSKLKNQNLPWDKEITKKWLPVDMYTGGPEHVNLHLMYFRFITMALHDLGYLDFDEPAKSFFAHGMIIKDGAKMSKSKGNVVNPDGYIAKFGADTLRLYLMFMGPAAAGGDFRDSGMAGMRRWVEKVYKIVLANLTHETHGSHETHEINKLIQKAAADIEKRHYNTAISAMMIFINSIADKKVSKQTLEKFLIVLSPFAPHLAEELWSNLSNSTNWPNSVHQQSWPKVEKIAKNKVKEIPVMIDGKVRGMVANDEIKIKEYLVGKKIKKKIYVLGKILSLVTA